MMGARPVAGIMLAIVGYTLVGIGVGSAGTSLLVLLAKRTAADRRAAAATIVWIMMIGGFALTAGVAGQLLDPFSPARLVAVTAGVAAAAFVVAVIAVWNVEGPAVAPAPVAGHAPQASFGEALGQVWAEPQSRRFAVFIFVSMLAYGAQDLILDPFAGAVFGFTPGQSTKLSGLQHGGVLVGMIVVAIAGTLGRGRFGSLSTWTIAGCIASAIALAGLAAGGLAGPAWPLRAWVFALGVANGAYAIAAIGSMMTLVAAGRRSREGVRMGLWGAAQAIAFGCGGFLGTVASDIARHLLGSPALAYSAVFACEATLFLLAALLAARIAGTTPAAAATNRTTSGYAAGLGGS
jgi:BCD family chlorophyll transporter-like MFS transporter